MIKKHGLEGGATVLENFRKQRFGGSNNTVLFISLVIILSGYRVTGWFGSL